jgi:hypothetical protein
MPVGPIGSVIYSKQVMHLQASKQTELQNSIEMQNALAAAAANEKAKEFKEVRALEDIHKIDPEQEHERQQQDEESAAREKQTKHVEHEHEEDDEAPLHVGLLDVKA